MAIPRHYDRSCSQHPPPLSRAAAPPLTLALPRSLAPEDSRQTLHSPPFTDRESRGPLCSVSETLHYLPCARLPFPDPRRKPLR
ncbi:unnamed protein product [Boreogadus saida]